MALRDWLVVATLATSATDNPDSHSTVADVATVAGARNLGEAGNDALTADRWTIHFGDQESIEVITTEPVTQAAILAQHPTAVAAEPAPHHYRPATTREALELRLLIHEVLGDDADRATAIRAALADVNAALICYRTLAGVPTTPIERCPAASIAQRFRWRQGDADRRRMAFPWEWAATSALGIAAIQSARSGAPRSFRSSTIQISEMVRSGGRFYYADIRQRRAPVIDPHPPTTNRR